VFRSFVFDIVVDYTVNRYYLIISNTW